jgi:Arc/MetJ family transcription regulator
LRTNIVLDDELVTRAFKVSQSKTKKGLVDEALRELVRLRSRKSLLDLKGQIRLREGYDYKRLRAGR